MVIIKKTAATSMAQQKRKVEAWSHLLSSSFEINLSMQYDFNKTKNNNLIQ